MRSFRIPLHIVFYADEDGDWIAHCLEFDLCGDGKSKETAAAALGEAIRIQVAQSIASDNLDNLFSPADGEYFRMFAAGRDIAVADLKIELQKPSPIVIESAEAREFFGDLTDHAAFQA